MIATPDLIDSLAANMKPVRRLRPPLLRAACWLLLAATVVALMAVSQGVRSDLMQRLLDPVFAAGLAGAACTGVLASAAAFLVSLPDRSRWWLLLPAPAIAIWLSNVGYQCLSQWISIGPDGVSLGEATRCLATLVLTSLPLSLAMLVMLRYVAPLRPMAVTLMGSLSVAAITATALSLLHAGDATLMIIMFNFGTAAVFVSTGGLFGRRMFEWIAPRADIRS
ncbi:NrsF family protein [Bradyrhizobium sp. HKCCYLS2038]|uniref:NrsF family protein n=1 Tax=unclassified Bradyrhizobium TaxID=2631580 RepID=UPI003EB754DA